MRNLLQKLAQRLHTVEDHLTLRVQIAAAAATISILLVGTLAAGAAFVSYRNTSELVTRSLATIAANTSGRLDRFMAVRQQELRLFAHLRPLEPLWQNNPTELRAALERLQQSYAEFAWIGFADINGTVVASTGGLLQGKSVLQRPWFKEGLERMTIGDVHEALLLSSLLAQRANGEPYRFVDMAMPVRDSEGHLLGVLGGHLNWDWAREVIKEAEDNDGNADTTLSIVSKSGTVLLGPAQNTVRYSGAQLANILKARDGSFIETAGDENVLTAYHVGSGHREYQGLNWIVTASQPTSVALAAAISLVQIIFGIGAVVALFGASLALVVSRRIAGPIIAITEEADRIGRTSGPTMLARQGGSVEVVQMTRALRSLLRRVGMAEERTKEAEMRATENAVQFQDDLIKLKQLADTDFLTGLLNRRSFLSAADDALQLSRHYKRGMATLMIDIDHFKKINDVHGHTAGDEAIKRIATIIGGTIRSTDKAARFGGEEFVVLLREIDQQGALILAERIRRGIETSTLDGDAATIPATVSVGVALLDETDRDVQDMIERADQGLYTAKKSGRNCVVLMPAAEVCIRAA